MTKYSSKEFQDPANPQRFRCYKCKIFSISKSVLKKQHKKHNSAFFARIVKKRNYELLDSLNEGWTQVLEHLPYREQQLAPPNQTVPETDWMRRIREIRVRATSSIPLADLSCAFREPFVKALTFG